MALDVYFPADLQNHIVAVAAAMLASAIAHGGTNVEYCRGVLDMARAQALNYGLSWPVLVRSLHDVLGECEQQDILELVDAASTRVLRADPHVRG